jgi:hypothetical protein
LLEKWLLQAERVLDTGQSVQLGGFRVVARRDRFWDALLSVLTTLHAEHPASFGRLMARCAASTSEEVDDPRGLDEALTAGQQALSDASGDRAERREQQGYVATSEAEAFLQLARRPLLGGVARDPLTTRYFRAHESRARAARVANGVATAGSGLRRTREPSLSRHAPGRRRSTAGGAAAARDGGE